MTFIDKLKNTLEYLFGNGSLEPESQVLDRLPEPETVTPLIHNELYEKARESDLKHYMEIMQGINPEFNKGFDIVSKPKDAQYFRDMRESHLKEMVPKWEDKGRDVAIQIIDEIYELVSDNPMSTEYTLENAIMINYFRVYHHMYPSDYQAKSHPYYGLRDEAKKACKDVLSERDFGIKFSSGQVTIFW